LFSIITDGITIEQKNKDEIHISYNESPKVVISTNFSISGVDDSTLDRQFIIEFSDYYNKAHRPVDDFGKPFFGSWNRDE
jgi:phage/plasmid-associated DNA primase